MESAPLSFGLPRGLPRTAAAAYVGCSPRRFDAMVISGEMPAPRMIGSKPVWDRIELDEAFDNLPRRGESANEWDAEVENYREAH